MGTASKVCLSIYEGLSSNLQVSMQTLLPWALRKIHEDFRSMYALVQRNPSMPYCLIYHVWFTTKTSMYRLLAYFTCISYVNKIHIGTCLTAYFPMYVLLSGSACMSQCIISDVCFTEKQPMFASLPSCLHTLLLRNVCLYCLISLCMP